jgi:hypothetical protein
LPAALALCLAALLLPGGASAQRMGIYFDEQGTICSSSIEPFGPSVHAWVIAYPGSAEVNVAVLSLRLPPDLHVVPDSEKFPFRSSLVGSGTLETHVEVIFQPRAAQPCRTGGAGIPIVEFDLVDLCSTCNGQPRPDILLHLVGAGADSIAGTTPQFRICDPNDPTNHPGSILATPLDAHLNCTANCSCTTALEPATWSGIKILYQDR